MTARTDDDEVRGPRRRDQHPRRGAFDQLGTDVNVVMCHPAQDDSTEPVGPHPRGARRRDTLHASGHGRIVPRGQHSNCSSMVPRLRHAPRQGLYRWLRAIHADNHPSLLITSLLQCIGYHAVQPSMPIVSALLIVFSGVVDGSLPAVDHELAMFTARQRGGRRFHSRSGPSRKSVQPRCASCPARTDAWTTRLSVVEPWLVRDE
jgi:hypothetical protein